MNDDEEYEVHQEHHEFIDEARVEALSEMDIEKFMDVGELQSLDESDFDEMLSESEYLDFNINTDMSDPKLAVGMKFANVDEFRKVLRECAISKGYDYEFEHNERKRITVKCKVQPNQCPFRVHASIISGEKTFQVKTFKPEHSCPINSRNSKMTSTYLAEKLLEDFRANPKESIKGIQSRLMRTTGFEVSTQQIYRARKIAMKIILGDHSSQFSSIRAYCELILQTNPGSTAVLMCELQPPTMVNGIVKKLPPRFQQIYVSFYACKAGFIAGCRPIIGLDEIFLKSHFGGHLLSAIGRDGDDGMFPIAMAVVEAENRESWTWFILQLLNGMNGIDPTNLVFISDMQKGLVQTFEDLLPNTEHRFCLKHLHENYKKQWKGKHYKDMLWQAANATTISQFDRIMKKLEETEDGKAYQYLKRLND